MRIRKRSAAGKLQLHEGCNGGLHLHAVSKSNPGSQDPRPSLLASTGIIKQDHSVLEDFPHGATNRPLQKQLPVEVVSLKRTRPCPAMSSGAKSCKDDNGRLMMCTGEESPKAKSGIDLQHTDEGKHMQMLPECDDNIKGVHMKSCEELVLQKASKAGNKLSEVCKAIRHNRACKRSALQEEIHDMHTDPATVDASDYPRKVRPLQLILNSDYSSSFSVPELPLIPLALCPTESNSTMPRMPSPLSYKFDKIADAQAGKERLLRDEDASSSCGSEQSLAGHVLDQAEFEPAQVISSWQGHRRPRSHVKSGFRRSAVAAADVNVVITKESPDEPRRRKPKQTKRKSIEILVSAVLQAPHSNPRTTAGNGKLSRQALPAARKLPLPDHTKKTPNEPLFLATSAAGLLPIPPKIICSLAVEPKPAAHTVTLPDHASSTLPAPALDDELQLNSMRCRRKDGRRWRCKAQVVKIGSPFCHYHTLKMREKHAKSVVRKLSKPLQGKVKINSSRADSSRSSIKSSNERREAMSPPSRKDMQAGCGGGCKAPAMDEEKGEQEDKVVEEGKTEDEQQETQAKFAVGKQQLQESATLKRRWRKKCKPYIRRLHDIHDRARPAATGVQLDFFNLSNLHNENSSPVFGSWSPLQECLLNSDPFEWRTDLP